LSFNSPKKFPVQRKISRLIQIGYGSLSCFLGITYYLKNKKAILAEPALATQMRTRIALYNLCWFAGSWNKLAKYKLFAIFSIHQLHLSKIHILKIFQNFLFYNHKLIFSLKRHAKNDNQKKPTF